MRKMRAKQLLMVSAVAFFWVIVNPNLYHGHGLALSIEEGKKNDVRFMSGGVGVDERGAMEDKAKDYSLKLVFAAVSGSYLSGIEISIQNRSGRVVFTGTSEGPWFFVDLPPGEYEVVATHAGDKQVRQIVVRGGMKTVMFHWNT